MQNLTKITSQLFNIRTDDEMKNPRLMIYDKENKKSRREMKD